MLARSIVWRIRRPSHPARSRLLQGAVVLGLGVIAGWPATRAAEPTDGSPGPAVVDLPIPDLVHFNRDVRPILSDACFACHGFDSAKRKADLRLDTNAGLFAKLDDGMAVAPGKPDESLVLKRVLSHDPDEVMPPPKAQKPAVTPRQAALLRRWIEQGAKWEDHWSFVPVRRPAVPAAKDAGGAAGAWVRNPIDAFVLDRLQREGLRPSPEADRTTLVRRVTLDLTGLPPTPAEVDAFLADRAPDAYEKLVDRLLTTSAHAERLALEWLDAARYADTHGYHIDAGRDMTRWREWVIDAFAANKPFDRFTVEQLAGDLLPEAATPEATLAQRVASGFNRNHMVNFEGGAIPEEYRSAYVLDRTNTTGTVWLGLTVACTQCHDHKYDPISQHEYYSLYAFFNSVAERGLDGNKGNAVPVLSLATPAEQANVAALTAAEKAAAGAAAAAKKLAAAGKGGGKFAAFLLAGASAGSLEKSLAAASALAKKQREAAERSLPSTMVMQEMPQPRETRVFVRGAYDHPGDAVTPGVPAFLPPLPKDAPANRLSLARWLVDRGNPLTARVTVNRYWQTIFGTGLVKTAEDFGSQGELPTHPELLDWLAAEFMDGPTAKPDGDGTAASSVTPGDTSAGKWDVRHLLRLMVTSRTYRQSSVVPPALLAKDPENRLLARGTRYRLGAEAIRDQALAAAGLLNRRVGGQSVSPYQPAGLWEELMSRGDGANWTAQTYAQSTGPDLYRRTMYTFWKRTCPPPTLATFDAPDREVCTVRRARTNTPLQALVLMNDPTYVEAARRLAERAMTERATVERVPAGPADGGGAAGTATATDADRAAYAFRLVLARPPRPAEVAVLTDVLAAQRKKFAADPAAAAKLLAVGESPRDAKLDPAELAAWSTVCGVILNLDETVTRG